MTEFDRLKRTLETFMPEASEAAILKTISLAKEKFAARQGLAAQEHCTEKRYSWIRRLSMKAEYLKRALISPWGIVGSSSILAVGLTAITI